MSEVLVVRHAQASFMRANYDELSPLGRRQAAMLGAHLSSTPRYAGGFTRVVHGPALRHRDTAHIIVEHITADGRTAAEMVEDPRLDEHDLGGLIRGVAGRGSEIPGVAQALHAFGTAGDAATKSRALHALTVPLVHAWTEGHLDDLETERWSEFEARVTASFTALCEGRGQTTLAITSVGPLALMLREALASPTMRAFECAWRARNACLTRFLAGPPGVTLDGFNLTPHLPDPATQTLR